MRQKNKISVFSLMFIFLSAFAGFADFNLGEIVVRPYDYGHEMEELPFSSSIITWNEIENSNIFSYSNSLENLPGVKVHRTGNFGRADIQIRGRGDRGRQIITLVNGRPALMGLFGCTITNSLPVENIQRIEVIRGPASVLYGSNSLGGAVNIVTRDEMKKGFSTVIRTSAGSFNSHRQRLRQSGRIDSFAYTFTGGLNVSGGFRENSAYESQSYTLGTRYRLTDSSQLSLRGAYYNGTKEYPEPSNNKRVEYERASVEADYEFKKVKGDHALKVYRNFGDHLFDNGNNFNDYTNGLLLNSAFDFSKKDKLNAGVEVRQMGGEHMRANMKIGEWNKYEFALFSLYRRKLGEKLRLSAGARYSIDEVARDVFLTQAGATYRISDNTILRLIRSEGFRYPQINDLYMFGASNESLEPETSANHEIGLLQKLGKGAYGD
ncbi:MAG: TonB-dependent receptor, partial [Elusimicrobiota bacterium]